MFIYSLLLNHLLTIHKTLKISVTFLICCLQWLTFRWPKNTTIHNTRFSIQLSISWQENVKKLT